MARGLLLSGLNESVAGNSCFAFSWGPFDGPMRITSIYLYCGLTTSNSNLFGIFIAPDAGGFTGSDNLPIALPTGWTPVTESTLLTSATIESQWGKVAAFGQSQASVPVQFEGLQIDLRGSNYFVKALLRNIGLGGLVFRANLTVILNPADADPGGIEVRPIPGGEPPTTPPTGEPPTVPPTEPPVTPPTGPPPVIPLPPAGPDTLPPITIDYRDPEGSVREFTAK